MGSEKHNKKKVAIVTPSFPPKGGGIASAHYHLYRKLKEKKFDVCLFTYSDNTRDKFSKRKHLVKSESPKVFKRLVNFVMLLFFRLIDGKKIAYETSSIVQASFGSLKLNLPIWRYKPDYLILPDHNCPGLFIVKPPHTKEILISHHNPARFLNNPLMGLHSNKDTKLALMMEKLALRKVDCVICPSAYMKKCFRRTYGAKRYKKRIYILPNLVDDKFIQRARVKNPRKKIDLQKESLLIYIPSAGSKVKGSGYVFELIRRLSAETKKQEIGFYLSGNIDDKLRYELKFLDKRVKIFNPGRISNSENISIIKACSFAVSPTLAESFGMSILEANFCGLPVVAFNTGGNEELIKNGENGHLVPYLDVESLVNQSLQLFNSKLRNKLRRKTLLFVKKRFDSGLIIDKYVKLLASLD